MSKTLPLWRKWQSICRGVESEECGGGRDGFVFCWQRAVRNGLSKSITRTGWAMNTLELTGTVVYSDSAWNMRGLLRNPGGPVRLCVSVFVVFCCILLCRCVEERGLELLRCKWRRMDEKLVRCQNLVRLFFCVVSFFSPGAAGDAHGRRCIALKCTSFVRRPH